MTARIVEKLVERRAVEVESITLDIIENALANARREMDHVVFRAAMSTIMRDQRDAFPLITDRDGTMIVGQFGSPIAGFMRGYDGTVEEGDIFLTSDPYACNGAITHANDWLVVKPIFVEGRLTGWSGIFGHMTDIGGRLPGSMPISSTELFEEGIIIPPTKICRNDTIQADLLAVILHNCRSPASNRADLMALIASVKLAASRVQEICARFGADTYEQALLLLLDRNRRAVAKLIDSAITEQKLTFEDYVCDDGLGKGPYKIVCSMQKRDGKVYFDFAGTDAQSEGSINFILNTEMFKMFVGAYLIKVYDPQIVFNAGYYDLIEVNIPEGSILAPRWPAALSCRTATLHRTFDVLVGLLGQRAPQFATAAGYSHSPSLYYNGYDKSGKRITFFYVGFGGVPARPVGDGHDGYTLLPSFMNIPNEYIESYAPLRVDRYEPIPDTGGPGKHRGGNGIWTTFVFLAPGDISVHDSRWLTYPWGVNGGMKGERSRKILERADGRQEVLPALFERLLVEPGDKLHFITWGGGGWGDPLERDPALVALETERGFISVGGARRYGVVLTPDLAVDQPATTALRAKIRAERGELPMFDKGPDIETLRAQCLEETGTYAPSAVVGNNLGEAGRRFVPGTGPMTPFYDRAAASPNR